MKMTENRSNILVIRLALMALQKELLAYLKEHFDRESGRITQPAEWLQIIMISERFHWMKELTAIIVDVDILSEFDEISDENAAIVKAEIERILMSNDENSSEFNKNYKKLLMGGAPILEHHSKLRAAASPLPSKSINAEEALNSRSLWHEEHRLQSRKRRN